MLKETHPVTCYLEAVIPNGKTIKGKTIKSSFLVNSLALNIPSKQHVMQEASCAA